MAWPALVSLDALDYYTRCWRNPTTLSTDVDSNRQWEGQRLGLEELRLPSPTVHSQSADCAAYRARARRRRSSSSGWRSDSSTRPVADRILTTSASSDGGSAPGRLGCVPS